MTEFKYKPAGEILKAYMKDDSFFRGIRGPVGSGKTVGTVAEVLRRSLQQAPNTKGIRQTRWAAVRNTGPQLKTTTIKTWLDWFPEEDWGPFKWSVPFTHHIMIGELDMEVIFLAMDDEGDIRKLLGGEFTGIWYNEAREMPKAVVDAGTMRVGRFPSMREGGPSWYGVLADTNAPEDDHWWPVMAGEAPLPEFITDEEALMLRKPPDWKFFNQPGGMVEERDAQNRVIGYEINPEAENIQNLPPDYYPKIITGKRKDWIDVYVLNKLGTVSEGKPVYPEYKEETHRAPEPIPYMPGRPLYVGLDFGFFPAAVFGQRHGRGRWNIIAEVCPEDVSTPTFCKLVLAKINEMTPPGIELDVRFYGDPTGDTRSKDTDAKKTTFQICRANGIRCFPAPGDNDLTIRIETVAAVLEGMMDGKPRMVVGRDCLMICKGFISGYNYAKIGNTSKYQDKPDKNKYSHPHDALQYLLLGAGEGRKLIISKDSQAGKSNKAKTKWPLFKKKNRGKRTRTGSI